MSRTPAPVVIVGAGPVGLTAALLLARLHVPAVILEAGSAPDTVGSKAICFQRDVLDILHRAGVATDMIAEGVTWTTARTYHRERELFARTFPAGSAAGDGPPPWINISQARVEALLRRQVAAHPLVSLRHDHRVTALVPGDGHVTVHVSGRSGGIVASHVVGCDGAASTVRDLIGLPITGRTFDDRFLIADIRTDLPFASERRFYFDPPWNPGRQVLVHHCPGGVWRIDWQVPADYDLEEERATGALDERIRRITEGRPYSIEWLSVYRFHQRLADSFQKGRVFLAGDAAHLYAPFGARGCNSGIQDAENLAWKIAFDRRGHAGEHLLPSYTAERRDAALENLRATGATMEFLVPQTEEQWERRNRTLREARTDPAAHSRVDSGRLAEPHSYASSPLTTPGPGAGDLHPDLPLPGGRLRTRLGPGFTVLLGGTFAGVADDSRDGALTGEIHQAAAGIPVTVIHNPGQEADVHVIRADGHLAATLPAYRPTALATVLRRTAGHPSTVEE
ncbi:FAD-dependent monooxygenase [Rhizohabitans arisaemae]|uniref:FAD-dependent monooxygenase n=1 Tax=Rhizohabitans arisaemae TaxID=2720610 RepID=UPI0024B19578|nr:FAD-dependent monooxygenase [Rhizohabitans arisaemae]